MVNSATDVYQNLTLMIFFMLWEKKYHKSCISGRTSRRNGNNCEDVWRSKSWKINAVNQRWLDAVWHLADKHSSKQEYSDTISVMQNSSMKVAISRSSRISLPFFLKKACFSNGWKCFELTLEKNRPLKSEGRYEMQTWKVFYDNKRPRRKILSFFHSYLFRNECDSFTGFCSFQPVQR
jgi:hypothetical protein